VILEGKTIVVSGVGPGLGREIATVAVRDGANVVMGARREDNLKAIAAALDPDGKRVAWAVTDITIADQRERLVETAVDRFGQLDGLVNCAALDSVLGGLDTADFAEWRKVFETNVFGSLQLTKAAVDRMDERGGAIVFIGSQAMFYAQLPQTAYAASKAALLGAVAQLVPELGPKRIRINTVVPTWMWGPPVEGYVTWTAAAQGVPQEEVLGAITSKMPLGVMPADEDVAEAVIFFLSDRSRMITGQSLLVNAGEYLR
jgi:NAD(P)-dependent dehydrogenase (short-subunit alcohol dehydrogenase family)